MLCPIKLCWYDPQPPFVTLLYGEVLLYCSCHTFNCRTSRKCGGSGFYCCLKSQFRIIVFPNAIFLPSQRRFTPLIVSFGKTTLLFKQRSQIVFSFIWAQGRCCDYQQSSCHVECMTFRLNETFSHSQWRWGLRKSHQWWGKCGTTVCLYVPGHCHTFLFTCKVWMFIFPSTGNADFTL